MTSLNEKIVRQQARLAVELLAALVPQVVGERRPADRLLLGFFKERRELGSRDRRFLSDLFFSYFRWLGWSRRLELKGLEAAALGWLLDRTEIHPALGTAVRPGWTPLGGLPLAQKRAALAGWFPEAPELREADLFEPGGMKSVDLPAGCEELFYEALQQRPPAWLRIRHNEFPRALAEAGIAFRPHERAAAVAVEGGAALAALGASGRFEVQDIASQAVALAADPAPGSDWWDACSGAGGKALHLADLIGPGGKVLATDVRPEALQECKKRARADGIAIIRTQTHNLADDPPFTKQFDGVLVDAPCSGRGTWGRNPDARWRSDARDPAQKRNLQVRMLRNAAACVKPGGRLVYAVCTFTREETVEAVQRFLETCPGFSPDPFPHPLTGAAGSGALQIWPWEGPGDGMFIARFTKAPAEGLSR